MVLSFLQIPKTIIEYEKETRIFGGMLNELEKLQKDNDAKVEIIRWTIGLNTWSDSLTAEQLESVRKSVKAFIEWPGLGK
jgi:hypothetical protein